MWIKWGIGGDKFLRGDLFIVTLLSMEENQNKSFFSKKFFVVLVLILLVAGGAVYYFWPEAVVDPGMLLIQNYEQAMREDAYGGKTPEETLKLFRDLYTKLP